MKKGNINSRITALLESRKQGVSQSDIVDALHLRGKERKQIQKWMSELVKGGIAVKTGQKWSLAQGKPQGAIEGVIDILRSGNGILRDRRTGAEIFIREKDVGMALPGDMVLARPIEGRSNRGERLAGVVRVLERGRHEIVGTLKSEGRGYYVVPLDTSYSRDFRVADTGGARVNDRVVARFTGWTHAGAEPDATIIDVIGPSDEPSLDTVSIVRQFAFREEFPHEVCLEAESVSGLVEKPGVREDFRDRLVITIDPERARDFDDALSLERDSRGNRILGVHIADVSHFIGRGSALDREAYERGNSVYFPDKVIPMLPEQLSNGICSLRPDEDRLTFSAIMVFDGEGRLLSRRFAKTFIRSKRRFTYEEAFAVLNGSRKEDGRTAKLLHDLNVLAQQLRRRRFMQSALDLDMPDYEVVMDSNGMIESIRKVENDISHQLVEECMVAANEAVASELASTGYPLLFRIHDPPSESKIEELSTKLAELGYRPGDLSERRNLANFLKKVAKDPLAYHVKVAVLRSMSRAVYSPRPGRGHYGLAKKFYAHFTSPIRRYPDLVVHRQLALLCDKSGGGVGGSGRGAGGYSMDMLAKTANHCCMTEQNADDAERAVTEIKKYRLLQKEIASGKPVIHDAVVVGQVKFGVFAEITDLQVQGLVRIPAGSMRRGHRRGGKSRDSGRDFKIGARIRVRVSRVDFDRRFIDFAPA